MKSKSRDSNMELLRIVSMLLVMIVHANFRALPYPTQQETISAPLSSFMRFGTESLSIICVNTFILLSGWYGIRFKGKRLAEFLFQVFFFSCLCLCFVLIFEKRSLSVQDLKVLLLAKQWNYWFVKSYLCLYIFSPILNSFAEQATKKHFLCVILTFFIFEILYGFITDGAVWFSHGYSGISFMAVYLLARYVKLHRPQITQRTKSFDISIYIAIVFVNTILAFSVTKLSHPAVAHKLFFYTSPLVIIQSLFFLLFFSKIHLRSLLVNRIAISCFAIYLVHSNTYIAGPYYDNFVRIFFYGGGNTFLFLTEVGLLILFFFCLSIILDKIRIYIWNLILKPVEDILRK